MDFISDLDVFFQEFAVDITPRPGTEGAAKIEKGLIFDKPSYEAEAGGKVTVVGANPRGRARTAHVADLAQDEEILVHASEELGVEQATYKVSANLPDGTGLSLLELRLA